MREFIKFPAAPEKPPNKKDVDGIEMPSDLLEEFGLTVWEADLDTEMVDADERRKYPRMNRGNILDEDVLIYCNNITNGVFSRDLLLDISVGGLLLISDNHKEINDQLTLEFLIKTQRFKLKGVVRRAKERKHGIQFIDPLRESTDFIEHLYGSSVLNKSRHREHKLGD